jgi:hypothetical protein
MKLLKSGLVSKDGIHFNCNYCRCEFLIEDRNDWTIQWLKDLANNPPKKVAEYYVRCPECHTEHCIGCNPNKITHNLITPFQIMFDREDWDERYDMETELGIIE